MSSRKRSLEQRFAGGEPKRILSLDGGGVRAIVAAGILAEVERRLAVRSGRSDFRLCEYFDLIGGTSTGAVLAAGLAMGRSCAEMADFFRQVAPESTTAKGRGASIRRPRFDAGRLEASLGKLLGDHDLSSTSLRTGLAIFAKRADTGAAWTLTNNPRAKYWNGDAQGAAPMKRMVVRKLVQASAGASTLFEEVRVKLDQDNTFAPNAEGLFVDGAVSGLNNPALQLFKLATLKSYGFEWPSGEDQILMLSVGAGYWRPRLDSAAGKPFEDLAPIAVRATEALKGMIHDTGVATIATMQALSRPPKPWRIDGELDNMASDHLSPFPLLTFQRLDVPLEREALATLALECTEEELLVMRELAADDATLARLHEIGVRAGQSYFRSAAREPRDWEREIFPARFDPAFFGERSQGQPRTRLDAMGRFFERPPGPGE